MSTRHRFSGKKLPLTLAFGALVAAAIGAACNGFFVDPTLTSINILPSAPSVQVNTSTTLKAYGVNSDGQGSYLTSGVSWSSSDITIATVTGNGSASLTGVGAGTATITASGESVTASATATVFMVISAIGISPTNPSISPSATQAFLVYANHDPTLTNPGDNLSSGATLTVTQGATTVTSISSSYDSGLSPPSQLCTASSAYAGNYTITATYPGSNLTATATLNIS